MGLTIERRREFAAEMARLSLVYVAKRVGWDGGLQAFRNVLTVESPVYRLTGLWDGKRHPASGWRDLKWESLVEELHALFEKTPLEFEVAGYALLAPLLEDGIERDVKAWPWTPCGYCPYKLPEENVFGSFAFEVARSGDSGETIGIHIGNAKMPHSPFEDMGMLRRELLDLTEHVRRRHPGVESIGCDSWLNSLDRFVAMFPSGWVASGAKPGRVGFGFNWWGQFMSRTGGFNFRNAEHMRKTGGFPFQSLTGRCSIASLRRHLEMACVGQG